MAARYRHYKAVYELVCEAAMEADDTPIIVYGQQMVRFGVDRRRSSSNS